MAKDKLSVTCYLTLEAVYNSCGDVIGAKAGRLSKKAPRNTRSVELRLELPRAMFKPLRLAVDVVASEADVSAEASVVVPADGEGQ